MLGTGQGKNTIGQWGSRGVDGLPSAPDISIKRNMFGEPNQYGKHIDRMQRHLTTHYCDTMISSKQGDQVEELLIQKFNDNPPLEGDTVFDVQCYANGKYYQGVSFHQVDIMLQIWNLRSKTFFHGEYDNTEARIDIQNGLELILEESEVNMIEDEIYEKNEQMRNVDQDIFIAKLLKFFELFDVIPAGLLMMKGGHDKDLWEWMKADVTNRMILTGLSLGMEQNEIDARIDAFFIAIKQYPYPTLACYSPKATKMLISYAGVNETTDKNDNYGDLKRYKSKVIYYGLDRDVNLMAPRNAYNMMISYYFIQHHFTLPVRVHVTESFCKRESITCEVAKEFEDSMIIVEGDVMYMIKASRLPELKPFDFYEMQMFKYHRHHKYQHSENIEHAIKKAHSNVVMQQCWIMKAPY